MMLAQGGTKVLIIARASPKWNPLLGSTKGGIRTLEIRNLRRPGGNTRDYSQKIIVVTDEQQLWQDEVKKALRWNRCVLLVSNSAASFQWAICLGDSIGVSVGPEQLEAVTESIASVPCKATLVLGYENDENGLRKAGKMLESKGKLLVPTVVDRICVMREIGEAAIEVRAEQYGRITALVPPARRKLLPPVFSSGAHLYVQAITEAKEYDFIRDKKKRLVNSLHATAAALVQRALMDVGARPETANDDLLGLIANNMDIHSQLVAMKELMILTVLGTLPPGDLPGDNLAQLIRELNDYGEEALTRMLEGPDAPLRVLKNDVPSLSAKYQRLFLDVGDLALNALRCEEVRTALPLTKDEIRARLSALNEAFLRLLTTVGKRTG
jgi:hypothetical protein